MGGLVGRLCGRERGVDDPELTPTENRWLLIVGLLLGAVVVLPALWLNLVLAFGR